MGRMEIKVGAKGNACTSPLSDHIIEDLFPTISLVTLFFKQLQYTAAQDYKPNADTLVIRHTFEHGDKQMHI